MLKTFSFLGDSYMQTIILDHTVLFGQLSSIRYPIKTTTHPRVRLRALFNYDPSDDRHIPCKDAGLDFAKGDILHIVSQEDPYW